MSTQMITERVTQSTCEHDRGGEHDPDHGQDRARPEADESLVEHGIEDRGEPGRPCPGPARVAYISRRFAPERHAFGVSRPSRQSSGTGACTAKALRRSDVNQRWSISLPWVSFDPAGQRPLGGGVSPRLSSLAQTRWECQRAIGPAGVGPTHAARDGEHGADQHRLAPGLGRVDQRLGPLRVEVVPVGAATAMLGVEVPDGVVARGALREVGVEPARRRVLDVTPAEAWQHERARGAARRATLPRGGEGQLGVLAQVVREPVARSGRERRLPRASACTAAPATRRGSPPAPRRERRARPQPPRQRQIPSLFNSGNSAPDRRRLSGRRPGLLQYPARGCSSMVEPQPSKLITRVRFPPPALSLSFELIHEAARPAGRERANAWQAER